MDPILFLCADDTANEELSPADDDATMTIRMRRATMMIVDLIDNDVRLRRLAERTDTMMMTASMMAVGAKEAAETEIVTSMISHQRRSRLATMSKFL
jgi:hypothetical protein